MFARIVKIAFMMVFFMFVAGLSTYLTVHLLIQSEEKIVVPDLEGKEIVHALEMLTNLKLNIKVPGSEFSATIPKNHIISQDPPAGAEIKQGRDVRLVISKGASVVVVPNLNGLSIPQARILLDQNGLATDTISHVYDPVYPDGDIVAQYPLPGHHSYRGDRVHLLASAGSAPKIVPMADLTGMGLDQAILALEQYHLTVAAIHYIDDDRLPDDTISDHSPQAGYPVSLASGVELSVIRKNKSSQEYRRSGIDLFRYRIPSGFLRRAVKVSINQPLGNVELFNAYVKPSEEIWLLVPFTTASTLFLYLDDDLVSTKHYNTQE
jgi:serine/threonine-protein kinase